MTPHGTIPDFTLFGETEHFPDVVHCERFSARAPIHGWRMSAHRHAHLAQIFLVHDGGVDAVIDDRPHRLSGGDFLFVPASKVHRFEFRPDTEGLVISVPQNVLGTIGPTAPDLARALSAPLAGRSDAALADLAALLDAAMAQNSPFRAQRAVGLAHSMLALIAERATDAATGPRRRVAGQLERLDRLIAGHMAQGWGAGDYAAALAISPGHLARLCRQATGKGAAAYIERAVMEEACRLLAFTQLPVSEIGYRLGFADPSYFSKRFRRARKLTPSDYRARFTS